MSYGTETMERCINTIEGKPVPPFDYNQVTIRCKVCDLEIIPPKKCGKVIITGWPLYVCECCVRTLHSSLCEA